MSAASTPGSGLNAPHPQFAQRVLDQMPSPLVVVDGTANVLYANAALLALVGRPGQDSVGENILDVIHPDDVTWLADAFVQLTQSNDQDLSGGLPSIHVRVVSPTGEVIPVEVTGARTIDDEIVGGVIYDVRPARQHDLLTHLLAGVSSGADVEDLLRLVTQLIAMPPLTLAAAVLERIDREWRIVTSTSDDLAAALQSTSPASFAEVMTEPHRCEPSELGESVTRRLRSAGYEDTWRLSVVAESERHKPAGRYEIITCNTIREQFSPGVTDRLNQARELARIVLMRSQNDRLMRHAATHDGLTGLLNRSAFRAVLDDALQLRHVGPESKKSVIFLDLDGFKPVNDRYGHAVGDEVLQVVAGRVVAAVRSGDSAARIGGDEFAVLLGVGGEGPAMQRAIAERIVHNIAAPIAVDGIDATVTVTASVGLAEVNPGETVDDVLGRADRLMYEAKRSGGSRLHTELRTD